MRVLAFLLPEEPLVVEQRDDYLRIKTLLILKEF